MAEQAEAPGPGVYPGVPMHIYHRWPLASNSRLKKIMQSPRHMKAAMDEEYSDTPAQRQGRISHTAILEPDEFGSRYLVLGQCEGQTKAGKRCSKGAQVYREDAGFCGLHDPHPNAPLGPVEVISEKERDIAMAQRDVVYRKLASRELLTGSGEVEMAVVWDDPETGIRCKARWDRHSPEISGGAIVDVKTCMDASRLTFERSIFNFGYYIQGGLYLDGARVRKLPAKRFVIVAVEKTPPFEVAVYRLTDSVVDEGLKQARMLLARYAECMEADHFPGYPDRVQDISIPPWGWSKIDDQNDEIGEAA